MVKEEARKELTQCQHCWRSRLELSKAGLRLSKCAGCQIAFYCSKECQKAAWPAHKTLCKLNSNTRAELEAKDKTPTIGRLQAFCAKHRPSFARLGIYAFDLKVDIGRCLRDVLHIRVAPNPFWDNKKAETAYLAFEVSVVPVEYFGEKRGEEMREQLKAFHDEQRRVGNESGFMVVFSDPTTGVSNVCGVGFGRKTLEDLDYGRLWEERLMQALNSGKVF